MTALTMDNQQRHMGSMGFHPMPYSSTTQFTNPWAASTSAGAQSQLYGTSLGYDSLPKSQSGRAVTLSMPYAALPASAPPLGNGSYPSIPYQTDLLNSSHDLLGVSRPSFDPSYSTASSSTMSSYAPASASFLPLGTYGQSMASQQQQPQQLHRSLHPVTTSFSQTQAAYSDAIDGAREMVALSQDITPRNIYGPRGDRGSPDSYGFPSTHSSHSSISSASTSYPYYAGSTDSSVTDYSSNSESVEPIHSRTLPRPSGLMSANMPPAPQSMMGQFNSKISSSSQKKHKCKVCDKRFTRPSSLQTHMYSHTGEKPFACEVPGCGRHFSVVSNLRRHRKVHKGERVSDPDSPDSSWASEKGSIGFRD